jgi:fluoroacetyl-CoA thioesterase
VKTVPLGLHHTSVVRVDRRRTVAFLGPQGRVYATPALVRDVENTCRDLVAPLLDEDEDTLGVEVHLEHLAPGLPGTDVVVDATVTEVAGRYVRFSVRVTDAVDTIAQGTHRRFVTRSPRTIHRLEAKRATYPGGAPPPDPEDEHGPDATW